MVKYNDTDGVWRTVGGRRIFIKNGQDLASAMKESGKFKKSKTEVKDEQKKFKDSEKEMTSKEASENQLKRLNEYEDAYDAYDKAMTRANAKNVASPSDLNTRTRNNADLAEKIINDDEWNDVRVSYQGSIEARIINERTGKSEKITPSDTKESLSQKIEKTYASETKSKSRDDNFKTPNDRIKSDYDTLEKEFPEYFSKNKLFEEMSKSKSRDDVVKQLNDEVGEVKNNKIPRDFEKGYGKFKVKTTAGDNLDDRYEITKDEFGQYHAKNLRTGETYQTFADHLRNGNVFEFEDNKSSAGKTSNPANMSDKDYNKFKESMKKSLSNIGAKDVKFSDEKQSTNMSEKEWSDKIKEIQNRPSYKEKMDKAVEELNEKYGYSNNETNNWKSEEGGVIKRETDKGTNYIQGTKKADGTSEYTRTDYDKNGNEISSKTYKSLDEAKNGKSTNEIMNDAIRNKVARKRNKNVDDLPQRSKIKTQGTSNRKEVSENIQAHILDYYDSPDDFIEQMDAMSHLPNNWKRGEEIAKGGSYLIYNGDMADFLNELKINPKGKTFSEDKAFDMYTSLVGRESAKLYDRLKKNSYKKYLQEHPNSDMSFAEFKDMRKQ